MTSESSPNPTAARCPVKESDVAEYEDRERIVAGISARLDADFEAGMRSFVAHESCGFEDLSRDLYAMAWRRGKAATEPARRRGWVDVLVVAAVQQGDFLAGQALKFLADFQREDFGGESWSALRELVFEEPNIVLLIRLVGRLKMMERREELERFAAKPVDGDYEEAPWAARLALARMGDEAALSEVIRTVRGEEEIVTRATKLFGDLAYTRQPAAFDVLVEYLRSKERLPQLKDTVPGTPEALHAAHEIAEHAVGAPLAPDDVDETEIDTIRRWAEAQSSWSFR